MVETLRVAGTDVFVAGTGSRTIVMLHGWPDTHESWRQQIDFFQADYTCVSFTMPGFDKADHSAYSLSDVVDIIHEIVDAVSPNDKVVLLAHDWGCVFGYEYAMRYSHRVEKMIAMDVGDADSEAFRQSLSLAQQLMVFTYQIILALGFVCGKTVATAVGRLMARALDAKSNLENVHGGMSMPYAMRWLGVNGGLKNLLPVDPPFPFYYAYAMHKPMMFHSPQWLDQLVQTPGNKVQAFDCGHWIMIDKADEFNASVRDWLRESQ